MNINLLGKGVHSGFLRAPNRDGRLDLHLVAIPNLGRDVAFWRGDRQAIRGLNRFDELANRFFWGLPIALFRPFRKGIGCGLHRLLDDATHVGHGLAHGVFDLGHRCAQGFSRLPNALLHFFLNARAPLAIALALTPPGLALRLFCGIPEGFEQFHRLFCGDFPILKHFEDFHAFFFHGILLSHYESLWFFALTVHLLSLRQECL